MPLELHPNLNLILDNPPSALSEVEISLIIQSFKNPTIKKYLDTLLWNQMRDLASIPITGVKKKEYQLQHAYIKGCIGMLLTLATIEQPQPSK